MDTPFVPPARLALQIYAGLTGSLGVFLILWGPYWVSVGADDPHGPFAQAALIRLVGAVLAAIALSAMAIAGSSDPVFLSRAINWFAGGQAVLWLMTAFQAKVVFKDLLQPGLASAIVWVGLVLLFGIAYIREAAAATAHRRGGAGAASSAKSRYDQVIREAASQEERHRLARDLHDSIKQQIFAIQAAAATAETRLESRSKGVDEALTLVRSSAREAMTEMEAMLDQLRATPLDNAGLVAALRKLCDALGFRTGASVTFTAGELPPDQRIEPGVRPALLRIAQEALANIARHARARTVTVRLESTDSLMRLSIADDGSGFEAGVDHAGMGLRNMKSRAEDVGGTLAVTARPGAGTTIRVAIPMELPAAATIHDKWRPWNSDILPWALAVLVGKIWDDVFPAALVGIAIWTVLRAWVQHRSRRRPVAGSGAAA